jgi:ABC-type Fe3+/spermidine/putrescine transport system ATPase subunit
MTFIYVTHSLESALVMSAQLFVIDEGELVQTGPPEEIYREPNDKFIAEFMGDANVFSIDVVDSEPGQVTVSSEEFEGSETVATHVDGPPEYLVVRYDDCVVESELRRPFGAEVEVDNVLVRGNTVLVGCS